MLASRHLIAALVLPLSLTGAAAAQPPAPSASPAPPPGAAASPPRQDIVVVLQGNQRPLLKLAFPAISAAGLAGPFADAAHEIEQALRADLLGARIFEIQGPAELAVLQLTGDSAHDSEQYRSLGNEVLLQADAKQEEGKIVLEGRILDLKSGQSIVGKRYRGELAVARRIAHSFADEVVLYFTGKRGVALSSIAFSSDRDGAKEIYLMDADGSNQRRITGHKSISMSPAWSPKGDTVAYVSFFDGGPSIYAVDLQSGQKRPLVADGKLNISPAYSPDGRLIAFARSLAGNTEIFVCDADGKNLRQLTHSPGIDTDPAWSPSGREIAFTSNRSGNPNIYVMDAEGTNVRRVTFSGDYNDGAAWRPDGTQIAYATRQGDGFQIAVVDVVTSQSKLLTGGPGSKERPTYSPDGRSIVYESSQGGSHQIWSMPSDGGEGRQLTNTGNNFGPEWSGYPPQ